MGPFSRGERLQNIRDALAGRGMVWLGTRGTDAQPLEALVRPRAIVSMTAPLDGPEWDDLEQYSLETATGRRVDLNSYSLDDDQRPAATTLKGKILLLARERQAIVPYRSAEFLAELPFTVSPRCLLAPFHGVQRLLEYKPWVEMQWKGRGLPGVAWNPIRNGDIERAKQALEHGPIVARTGLGSGGARMHMLHALDEYRALTDSQPDGYSYASTYLDGAVPLNINACVYNTGEVATFGLSYQLIGIKECTNRPFGFCGNDFLAASVLPFEVTSQADALTREVGRWLHGLEYRGVFGLDLLLAGGELLLCELNPRFQASTPMSVGICAALGEPDPFSEHVAACLGLPAPATDRCPALTSSAGSLKDQVPLSHVMYYNTTSLPQYVAARYQGKPDAGRLSCVPAANTQVDPEGLLYKGIFLDGVTKTGYEISTAAREITETLGLTPC